MRVHRTNAGVLYRSETVTRADGAIDRETPFHHVSVPAGFHLGDQHHLLAELRRLAVSGDTAVIASVGAGLQSGRGDLAVRQNSYAWNDVIRPRIRSVEHTLLILPVAEGAAEIARVGNVQDGHVAAFHHQLAFVFDVADLDSGTFRGLARGR